ncbi:MAG: type IX secretion system sortase PorU [Bacteroidota bacterium]
MPVIRENGEYKKLTSFTIKYEPAYEPELKYQSEYSYPENSVLSSGNWYKICVEDDGVYKLDFDDLVSLGIPASSIEKSSLQIFGNGGGMLPESNSKPKITDLKENAIWISGGNTGNFSSDDYILFYGQSPHRWKYNEEDDLFTKQLHYYSNQTCYFITYGQGQGKRINEQNSVETTPDITVTDFYDYRHHEQEIRNLTGSGKIWYGELFEVTLSRDFSFDLTGTKPNAPARIKINAAARSSNTSGFTISSQGNTSSFNIESINIFSYTGIYARSATGYLTVPEPEENLEIKLTYNNSAAGSSGWLNYITVNYIRQLAFQNGQLSFRNPSATEAGNVAEYQISNMSSGLNIWDITDPLNISEQQYSLQGSTGVFRAPSDQLREFIIFDQQDYLTPKLSGSVDNQNLHASEVHDLVIVVPSTFKDQAERLADFRRNHDNLSVLIVTPQQVYNEFSSGIPDISAIRNFMKMFYDRGFESGNYPRYLLLFGNGTYDNKDLLGHGGNLIPTFQTLESFNPSSSYITDDFFGLLDDHEGEDALGAIDLGIGRLPVRTSDEARFIVDKLIRYNQRIEGLEPGTSDPRYAGVISNYADWRNKITLIGDDEDSNIHLNQSERIAQYLDESHPVFNIEKIYLDAYQQQTLAGGSRYPDVNKAINNRMNQGALLINYIGHGGVNGLAHERILTFEDILSWNNFYNLPVFMTATCEFSSFDQPDANDLSAGVRVFLKPDGGASALFTTTRLAYSHSNFTLNDAFMRNAFVPMENGDLPRLGDLIRISKVESSSAGTLKNFVLLGDPSMQMAYPRYEAVTTEIPDTIRALQKVTIKGEIHTPEGSKAQDYSGVIFPTVYDKTTTLKTLANDPGSSQSDFNIQNRIIFKGMASVEQGEFEFSFIVPKDITYITGQGKISYYFDDGHDIDGYGYYDDFIITGTSSDEISDTSGPGIEIFIDDENFISGGKTSPNPLLIAHLSDESGINTTGQIGHDIVAFLNNDSANPLILNNYYQTRKNNFTQGTVIYPFHNLEKGTYTLEIRAWDVLNNVSSESIEFVVDAAPEINIEKLVNVPNPFSESTSFMFDHNKPATEMLVQIEIFSLNGQLVKSIESNVYASGFNIPPIEWDGRDEGGTLLENGIYIFRVKVSTENDGEIQKDEKLIILR